MLPTQRKLGGAEGRRASPRLRSRQTRQTKWSLWGRLPSAGSSRRYCAHCFGQLQRRLAQKPKSPQRRRLYRRPRCVRPQEERHPLQHPTRVGEGRRAGKRYPGERVSPRTRAGRHEETPPAHASAAALVPLPWLQRYPYRAARRDSLQQAPPLALAAAAAAASHKPSGMAEGRSPRQPLGCSQPAPFRGTWAEVGRHPDASSAGVCGERIVRQRGWHRGTANHRSRQPRLQTSSARQRQQALQQSRRPAPILDYGKAKTRSMAWRFPMP